MPRKVTDGEFRNKERTKLKLINAVGEIIRTQGYTKLGVNNIARQAQVSKKLIYTYFETVDNLIETYIKQKDYWISLGKEANQLVELNDKDHGKKLALETLEGLFEHLLTNTELRKIILWEISEHSEIMKDVSTKREMLGSQLFALTDPLFEKSKVDIKAIYAILLGGIYYLSLHSNATGGKFCEIDIKMNKDKQRINNSVKKILEWTFQEASSRQKK